MTAPRSLFTVEEHTAAKVTWGVYRRMAAPYRDPDRATAGRSMVKLFGAVKDASPTEMGEAATLGRTVAERAEDMLVYFDRPGTSNGPTEAINGRLEHLRGSALVSETPPTMSSGPSSRPEASDRYCTLICRKPFGADCMTSLERHRTRWAVPGASIARLVASGEPPTEKRRHGTHWVQRGITAAWQEPH